MPRASRPSRSRSINRGKPDIVTDDTVHVTREGDAAGGSFTRDA